MNFDYLFKIFKIIRYQKISLIFLIILTLISSLIELLGIGIIYSFVNIVINPDKIIENNLMFYLPFIKSKNLFEYLSIFILIVFFLRAFTAIYLNKVILELCFGYGANLRRELMEIYLNKNYSDFKKKNNSEYLYHINTLSIQFSQQILLSVVRLLCEFIVIFTITIYIVFNFGLEFFIIATITIIFLYTYDKIFKIKISNYGKKINKISNNLIQIITESLNGYKELDILDKKKFIFKNIKNLSQDYADLNVKQKVITHAPRYLLDFIIIFSIFVMIFALQLIYSKEFKDYIPMISIFAFSAMRFIPSSNVIIRGISHIRFGKNTVERIYDDLIHKSNTFSQSTKIINPDNMINNIHLKNVNFSYGNNKIIKDLNLEINKNDFVGIMGKSGSGKTTLIDVILGFYKIESGQFLINGKEVAEPYILMKNKIAYIPQSNFFMDQSLKLNISLDENLNEESENKLNNILDKLDLRSTIDDLPNGINTKIGDKDYFLSGGQIQRVAIARALFHDRQILIFDESTNSLDENTESMILSELSKLATEKTIIIISHKKNSLKFCNKVFLLKNKKLEYIDKNII